MKTPIQTPLSRGRLLAAAVKLMITTEPLNRGAQVNGHHDGNKLEGCSILHVIFCVTPRYVVFFIFLVVISHEQAISLGVLLSVLLAGSEVLASERHDCACNQSVFRYTVK
ncbi:hypothetical protein P280DRAFT_223827 [Massarina eburnea CBS 473.64]|uniref:Uncharacterized protein n=1 Tax=Massarina eburnea CBS 473.64 TaxID=1395130 RepID=A0A6A6SCE4_9PLEO|nr:hypothetical protein P280DRAFT_223827 [Massarina eburnea CBS 473.64]